MRVAVPKETGAGERRVALVPDAVGRLAAAGFDGRGRARRGRGRGLRRRRVRGCGRRRRRRGDLLAGAEAVVRVAAPSAERSPSSRPGTVLIGFLPPLTDPAGIERLAERGVVAFAMESIPRITRAQSMDALSSQSTVAGYKAVVARRRPAAAVLPAADDRGRDGRAGEGARARRGRRRPAGDRDRAAARRGRLGLRRAAGRAGAGREPRRDVPRPRHPRRGDERRLRARADAGGAGAAAGSARGADPGVRRRRSRPRSSPAGRRRS